MLGTSVAPRAHTHERIRPARAHSHAAYPNRIPCITFRSGRSTHSRKSASPHSHTHASLAHTHIPAAQSQPDGHGEACTARRPVAHTRAPRAALARIAPLPRPRPHYIQHTKRWKKKKAQRKEEEGKIKHRKELSEEHKMAYLNIGSLR